MPFDPIDFFRREPSSRPDPSYSTGGKEIGLLAAGVAAFCLLVFIVLFPIPLIVATQAYDFVRTFLDHA